MISGKPISPDEISEAKGASIPPFVFDAFNELIALKFDCGSATIKQDDVINKIITVMAARNGVQGDPDATRAYRDTIFQSGWLNVEDVYRAVGWSVEYDRPGYNEIYSAFFVFKKK